MEYKKYRVRTPVKSFRDLEVYKITTQLAAEIFKIKIPKEYQNLEKEFEILKTISKQIPKLIAESHGNKFTNIDLALNKLETSMQLISNIVTKIDFLMNLIDDEKNKEQLRTITRKYQTQKIKIRNLKRAWERVFNKK